MGTKSTTNNSLSLTDTLVYVVASLVIGWAVAVGITTLFGPVGILEVFLLFGGAFVVSFGGLLVVSRRSTTAARSALNKRLIYLVSALLIAGLLAAAAPSIVGPVGAVGSIVLLSVLTIVLFVGLELLSPL